MSLEATVATPFRQAGTRRIGEGEFVVALSLDRDWFSPDQADRLIDVAAGRGLLTREDGDLRAEFDPMAVSVPEGFVPEEDVLREQSTFERILAAVTDAGVEKREAVAGINQCQQNLGVTIEAAAVLYARRRGIDIGEAAAAARADLAPDAGDGRSDAGGAGDAPGE
jgi:hypothetical protein